LAIRLLVTAGSRLLDLAEIREQVGAFASRTLTSPWRHRDAAMDRLCEQLQVIVEEAESAKESRRKIFEKIWRAAHRAADRAVKEENLVLAGESGGVPYLNEPWYC